MKHSLIHLLIFITFCGCHKKADQKEDFSLHLFQEPLHLDPVRLRGSSASYFFYNTLRGLYRYDSKKGLVSEGGLCHWKTPLRLVCEIKGQKWSNGEDVTVDDYFRSFYRLIDPQMASPRSSLLGQIKNASDILQSKKPLRELGIVKLSPTKMAFNFSQHDSEFIFKLTSTALFPIHSKHSFDKKNFKTFVTNGPYQIGSWNFGKQMTLTPNPFYTQGHPLRPQVTFYFIDDEMTALRLYLNNKLSFLRRIPASRIIDVKDRDDFFLTPMARFDYIGFGKRLQLNKNLRQALAHSVNYEQLKKILNARGRPGCPSLPSGWITKPPCYEFNLKKAQAYFKKVKPEDLKRVYHLKVSQLGGSDIKKQAEFFQNQWKTHLGLNIQISQVEQKVFLNELRTQPPDIFRKGVGLDRPTCLNALETFSSESKQNFISWKSSHYFEIIKKMNSNIDQKSYKTLCKKAISLLMNEAIIIPLGEMHFSLMASPKFEGWSVNSMNQLDLSQLHPTKPK